MWMRTGGRDAFINVHFGDEAAHRSRVIKNVFYEGSGLTIEPEVRCSFEIPFKTGLRNLFEGHTSGSHIPRFLREVHARVGANQGRIVHLPVQPDKKHVPKTVGSQGPYHPFVHDLVIHAGRCSSADDETAESNVAGLKGRGFGAAFHEQLQFSGLLFGQDLHVGHGVFHQDLFGLHGGNDAQDHGWQHARRQNEKQQPQPDTHSGISHQGT
jgi:hypothetical protein